MTQLLVSVRSAIEAQAALAGGADYIDVKEPSRGPLGFADAGVLRAIAAQVGDRAVLSAALGELGDALPSASLASLENYRFAKLGLAGVREISGWPQQWRTVVANLPPRTEPVAVAYADWRTCGAPSPAEIFAQAGALNRPCRALLVDTFAKSGATIFQFISTGELADVLAAARAQGMRTLVAGSLRQVHLPQIIALSPDVVAVRGAVCVGGREGNVDPARVAEFRAELARHSHHAILPRTFGKQPEFA
jgi:uncharacterized protein (UPF0264 family)